MESENEGLHRPEEAAASVPRRRREAAEEDVDVAAGDHAAAIVVMENDDDEGVVIGPAPAVDLQEGDNDDSNDRGDREDPEASDSFSNDDDDDSWVSPVVDSDREEEEESLSEDEPAGEGADNNNTTPYYYDEEAHQNLLHCSLTGPEAVQVLMARPFVQDPDFLLLHVVGGDGSGNDRERNDNDNDNGAVIIAHDHDSDDEDDDDVEPPPPQRRRRRLTVDPAERSRQSFQTFVNVLLLAYENINGVYIGSAPRLKELHLEAYDFRNEELYRSNDSFRLFLQVFRLHPCLQSIRLEKCSIPTQYLKALSVAFTSPTAARPKPRRTFALDPRAPPPPPPPPLGPSSLRELYLNSCHMDKDGIWAVVRMNKSKHCRLRVLEITAGYGAGNEQANRGGLDSESCRWVCDAIFDNPRLRRFRLDVHPQVEDYALGGVANSTYSSIRSLSIRGAFTREAFAMLLKDLRTNTKMFELYLTNNRDEDVPFFRAQMNELVQTYNYTLRRVRLDGVHDTTFLNKPNRRVRTAVRHLERNQYRIGVIPSWPLAMQQLGTFPTLLYRLLRKGNVDELYGVVSAAAISRERKKRRVEPADEAPTSNVHVLHS